MVRVNTKIGDVFSINFNEHHKKYFQYIANDLTQLNSDVIRAFKKVYPTGTNLDLSEIINDEVDFYAHCVTKWGVKMGLWEKIGNIREIGGVDIYFRASNDYGSKPGEQIKLSNSWRIWKINQELKQIGKLEGKNKEAEIGIVISPPSIVHRIKTGKYDFFYPGYE